MIESFAHQRSATASGRESSSGSMRFTSETFVRDVGHVVDGHVRVDHAAEAAGIPDRLVARDPVERRRGDLLAEAHEADADPVVVRRGGRAEVGERAAHGGQPRAVGRDPHREDADVRAALGQVDEPRPVARRVVGDEDDDGGQRERRSPRRRRAVPTLAPACERGALGRQLRRARHPAPASPRRSRSTMRPSRSSDQHGDRGLGRREVVARRAGCAATTCAAATSASRARRPTRA